MIDHERTTTIPAVPEVIDLSNLTWLRDGLTTGHVQYEGRLLFCSPCRFTKANLHRNYWNHGPIPAQDTIISTFHGTSIHNLASILKEGILTNGGTTLALIKNAPFVLQYAEHRSDQVPSGNHIAVIIVGQSMARNLFLLGSTFPNAAPTIYHPSPDTISHPNFSGKAWLKHLPPKDILGFYVYLSGAKYLDQITHFCPEDIY